MIIKKVWIPSIIDKCHDGPNIPCSFIDAYGYNKTGYYNMYDIIQINPKKAATKQKRGSKKSTTKPCKNVNQIFSLPSGTKKILRIGENIIFKDLTSISSPLDAYKFFRKHNTAIATFYKETIQNDTQYLVVRDLLFFIFFLFCVVIIIVIFVKYKGIKSFYFRILKQTSANTEPSNLLPTWHEFEQRMQEERDRTNVLVSDIQDILTRKENERNKLFEDIIFLPKTDGQTKQNNAETKSKFLHQQKINGTQSEVTLFAMETDPSQISLNMKKDFCRKNLDWNMKNSGETAINKKIIEFLKSNINER